MSRLLEDYSFELPPDRIAQRPTPVRDRSRLMVLDRTGGEVEHRLFTDLPGFLGPGDLVVLNDTFVKPARIFGVKEGTGGRVELLLVGHLGGGYWRALMRGKGKAGTVLDFGVDGVRGRLVHGAREGEVKVRFDPPDGGKKLMMMVGYPPLPPYIGRTGDGRQRNREVDVERYQTVYASSEGSVAAPTAGLHFTEGLLERIRKKGAGRATLTLHVGPGTFRPLRHRDIERNRLEEESAFIPAATAEEVNRVKERGGRVIAVGTTVTRTLEAFTDREGRVRGGRRRVDLFIRPGHRFRTVNALITNFHLPRSSLMLLVSAFAGREKLLDAYRLAIGEGYRFYSYGDAMFIS
jgi:S-adenosylmethionine:tRNA ribosyltransferase-isomerase